MLAVDKMFCRGTRPVEPCALRLGKEAPAVCCAKLLALVMGLVSRQSGGTCTGALELSSLGGRAEVMC